MNSEKEKDGKITIYNISYYTSFYTWNHIVKTVLGNIYIYIKSYDKPTNKYYLK